MYAFINVGVFNGSINAVVNSALEKTTSDVRLRILELKLLCLFVCVCAWRMDGAWHWVSCLRKR